MAPLCITKPLSEFVYKHFVSVVINVGVCVIFTERELCLSPIVILSNRIQTDLLNLSQVPEPPKKIVPEKKVPAPAPKKEKVPPAKGILGIILLISNTSLPVLMLN